MDANIIILKEPKLEFSFHQKLEHPIDGLMLFGPNDLDKPSQPKSITYGLIGTKEGIKKFKAFSKLLNKPLFDDANEARMALWPMFPGFEAAFHCKYPEEPAWEHEIDDQKLLNDAKINDPNKRAYAVVEHYIKAISNASKNRDENIRVMFCIVPEEVYKNCRPMSRIYDGEGPKISKNVLNMYKSGQSSLSPDFNRNVYQLSEDFRKQLKARVMEFNIPVQIIRESTLELEPNKEEFPRRGLTPLSDRAWNLSIGMYYKAGGKPWKLATAREGVCYIGIAFKKSSNDPKSKTATSAAQMFLDSGDGVVFLGDEGPWYSKKTQYHLDKEAAKKLLKGVLETYKTEKGKDLTEIFLHSRSSIDLEEFEGYKEACPPNVKLVAIRVKHEPNLKLFREGTRPVLRGTFLKVNRRLGYLWGSGFKPRLETYDGHETPTPIRIDVQHGETNIEQVAEDILSLTKLNYNCNKLGDSQPVTIKYSDAVGEILVYNKGSKYTKSQFKFYI